MDATPQIHRVHSDEEVRQTAELAREIWTEHYLPIIGGPQVEYMLRRFQTAESIREQQASGVEYYTASLAPQGCCGYLAVLPGPETTELKVSKLYVRASARGRGVGRALLERAEEIGRSSGFRTLWLTVNKRNAASIMWYERRGFERVSAVVQDIGGGFVMDDYRLEKPIKPSI